MQQNKIDLEESRRICDAATPGPWRWNVNVRCKDIGLESPESVVMDFVRYGMDGAAPSFALNGVLERADRMAKSLPGKEHHVGFDDYIDHPDAAFIAYARTALPQALDEIERLRAERDYLLKMCAYCGACKKFGDEDTHGLGWCLAHDRAASTDDYMPECKYFDWCGPQSPREENNA